MGGGDERQREKGTNIELISETDYKQFRTAALWPMRRHGANGKGGYRHAETFLVLLVALALVLFSASVAE